MFSQTKQPDFTPNRQLSSKLVLGVVFGLFLASVVLFLLTPRVYAAEAGRQTAAQGSERRANTAVSSGQDIFKNPDNTPWRLRILEAAIVNGPAVTIGEIAVPVGDMDSSLWRELSQRQLWASPSESGRPVNLTRPRLQQAMLSAMGQDFAALCLYPPALALQRGGRVLGPAEVQNVVVKTLTPLLGSLPGEAMLSDFRLPANVFLSDSNHVLELETPKNITPGRLSLRFLVRELDGGINKRLTGTVFVDCWASVPSASVALNRDEVLDPAKVTFMRKNLAQIKDQVWDGKGGPWRLTKPVLAGQPIMISDLTYVPTVARGNTITLVYQAKTVRLSVKAEAMADGVKGETIPVRNLSSKKQVYATVMDAGTAVIESRLSGGEFSEYSPAF